MTTRARVKQRARARLLLLAACGLLCRVLASGAVYAQAPPAASPTTTKPAPQKPGAKKASTPAPASDTNAPASGTSAQVERAPARETSDAAAAEAASKPAAKSATKKGGKGKQPAAPKSGRKGKGGKNVIDEEFLIEGKLEKPNAYYILRRSQVDFDWARLDARFSPLVLESVQDPLF
jgi:hypothetical protein